MELLDTILQGDQDNIQSCVEVMYSSCPEDFSAHFADKAYKILKDDRIVGDIAVSLIGICAVFIRASPERYCDPALAEGIGLVPYLLIACRRQICGAHNLYKAQLFVI